MVAVPEDSSFQSTPSAWRETVRYQKLKAMLDISIHSLRMEGDGQYKKLNVLPIISIHSLRMEGDGYAAGKGYTFWEISIHSLRMEGDR